MDNPGNLQILYFLGKSCSLTVVRSMRLLIIIMKQMKTMCLTSESCNHTLMQFIIIKNIISDLLYSEFMKSLYTGSKALFTYII